MDQNQASNWFTFSESKLFEFRLSKSIPVGDRCEWWAEEYLLNYDCMHPTPSEWFESRNDSAQMIVKIPFEEVPHLIKSRDVQLKDGFALVPFSWMSNVVVHKYHSSLKTRIQQLQVNSIYNISNNPQLHATVMSVVEMLRCQLQLNEHTGSGMGIAGSFTLPQLRDAAKSKSLPLCAYRLYNRLDKAGWLHYDQRRQYVLFLKSCGLQLEGAINLLQSAHKTSHLTAEVRPKRKWDRYDYDIHHMYGLRGKRVASQPFSCSSLAEIQPKPSDGGVGGCPFANLDTAAIKNELESLNISTNGFFDNVGSGRSASVSMCKKHFALVHDGAILNVQGENHPAHWTLASLNHLKQSKNR